MIYTIEHWEYSVKWDTMDDHITTEQADSEEEAIEKARKNNPWGKHFKVLTKFTKDEKLETTTSSE